MNIDNKHVMFAKLIRGDFGNTVPQYLDLDEWMESAERRRYGMWGVRTLTPGGPCRLYCPTAEVNRIWLMYRLAGHACNVSCMIDACCTVTLWAEILDAPGGIQVYGIEYPGKGASWRKLMPMQGRMWMGIAANLLLHKYLNASSYADLEDLLEQYPEHVVELSATEERFGTVPHRNAVIWEVRNY